MAEETFAIAYQGPALDTGRMDVKDLAPALIAFGELFQLLNREVNPGTPEPSLHVVATEQGSFEVHLVLAQSFIEQVVSMFSGSEATAIANLLAYVTSGTGLFGFLAHLAHRRISGQRSAETPGQVIVEFDDGTTITVPIEVLNAARNIEIRKTCQEVVRPLGREGVTSLAITSSALTVQVSSEQLPGFEIPAEEDTEILNDEHEIVLSLASVAFRDGNKWRLSDGQNTFHATMSDERFLVRVDNGEQFAKGDVLRCRLRTTQYTTSNGLRTEYDVIEVIEHINAARVVKLPFET